MSKKDSKPKTPFNLEEIASKARYLTSTAQELEADLDPQEIDDVLYRVLAASQKLIAAIDNAALETREDTGTRSLGELEEEKDRISRRAKDRMLMQRAGELLPVPRYWH